MSMKLKKQVKELEERVEALEEKAEEGQCKINGDLVAMAEKKQTGRQGKQKTKSNKKKELLPFDELPIVVKRNRKLLYEYIRTGELP